jgi:hypothetical protein
MLCEATPEENLDNSQFSKTEKPDNLDKKAKEYFTSKDVNKILNDLGYPASKTEID